MNTYTVHVVETNNYLAKVVANNEDEAKQLATMSLHVLPKSSEVVHLGQVSLLWQNSTINPVIGE